MSVPFLVVWSFFVRYIYFCQGFQWNLSSFLRRECYFDNQVFLERLLHLLLERNFHRFDGAYMALKNWCFGSFFVNFLKVSPSSRIWRAFYLAKNSVILFAHARVEGQFFVVVPQLSKNDFHPFSSIVLVLVDRSARGLPSQDTWSTEQRD